MLSAWINNTGTTAANAMRDIYNSIKIDWKECWKMIKKQVELWHTQKKRGEHTAECIAFGLQAGNPCKMEAPQNRKATEHGEHGTMDEKTGGKREMLQIGEP